MDDIGAASLRRIGRSGTSEEQVSVRDDHGYAPLRDYALIGDCHGAALVSLDGSIDWCTFLRFDAAPMFGRVLDHSRGGCFQIVPSAGRFDVSRRYLPATNILETTFHTSTGATRVIDFMPVGRRGDASVHDYVSLFATNSLVRIIQGIEGVVEITIHFDPTLDYGAHRPTLTPMESVVSGSDGSQLRSRIRFRHAVNGVRASTTVHAGERHELVVYPAMSLAPQVSVDELLNVTTAFWTEWTGYIRYSGEYREQVVRSALALKLMTHAPSGALVASPTTSLPEWIGGERNWDYRYCWLRDSTLTLYALSVLGFSGEAARFHDYLLTACHSSYPRLQIMYGIDAEAELPERTLDYLEGYARSAPVRIGNGAYDQHQHDVIGDVVAWAHLHDTLVHRLGRSTRSFIAELANRAVDEWKEADSGLWESRGNEKHYVYSKVMSWVAADRAARISGTAKEKARWRVAASEIVEAVRRNGIDAHGRFVRAFGDDAVDPSLLRIPFTGFPVDDTVFSRTVARLQEELTRGAYVYRNREGDGVSGAEGAFLLCSFWLVDALLWLGRYADAQRSFAELSAAANDVGLYSEEIDPRSGSFLGNLPQAFTHLAFVRTASLLELASKDIGAVKTTDAERARTLVGATAGPLALWKAFRQSGRVGRIRSSHHSKFPSQSDAPAVR